MAIAVDQANLGEVAIDTSDSTIVLTTSAAAAAGSRIILTITFFAPSGVPSLSSVSGGGLTWNVDGSGRAAGQDIFVAIVSADAPSGLASGTTITATLSGASSGVRSMCASSFTGIDTTTPVDVVGSLQGPSTTAWTTGSLTIAAGSMIVGLACTGSSNYSSTATSPSVETHDVNGGAGTFAATTAYRVEAAAGSYAVAGTWSGSAASGSYLGVAYKAAPGGGGGQTHPYLNVTVR